MESTKKATASPAAVKGETHRGAAIGGAIGHTIGAVAGGIAARKNTANKRAAEPVNPTAEHEFWRKECGRRPYFTTGTPYGQYGPAYQFGWESYAIHTGKTFKEVELQLERDWENCRGQSKLSWSHAKGAAHDAWHRVEKAAAGESCCSA